MAVTAQHYLFGGVDPGLTGGIGFLEEIEGSEHAWGLPIPLRMQGRRQRVNRDEICGVIRYQQNMFPETRLAFAVEAVGTRPHEVKDPITGKRLSVKESAEAMVRFGQGQGEILGILSMAGALVFEVPPSVWKMKCGLVGLSKKEVCKRAMKLFPGIELFGPRGGAYHGLAEALFLALYCRMIVTGKGIEDCGKTG